MMHKKEGLIHIMAEILASDFDYPIVGDPIGLVQPKNRGFGDYSTNIAMRVAKDLGKDAMVLALHLQRKIKERCPQMEKITVESPGFINFYLGDDAYYHILDLAAKDYEEIVLGEKVPYGWKENLQHLLEEEGLQSGLQDVLYVHSRIYSVIKLLKEEGISLENVDKNKIAYEKTPREKEVLKRLAAYPEVLRDAVTKNRPLSLLEYAILLARLFLELHQGTLLRKLQEERLYGTLGVMEGVGLVLKSICDVFGIEAPEKM
ncbi:DALR anticodon-binding domain-containing protein [Thermotalea metallivorans]|uniref:arginine--tRNA ligase n=1 Tax=Thermotalea metallivorans TaxID=520762 RepID=A0A140L6M8_9FIRM|nr:DALR anticodon-binding domain-containing protein [Thermotalea metallivorans]KXG76203.1 hypothetical protein AN619_11600 [Thermotalea metallivorans]